MKKLGHLILFLLTTSFGFAQSPGGLPTTNLVSWQHPGNIIDVAGDVTGWGDASPVSTNDYGDHGSPTERPVILVGDANGYDVVQFNGVNDYLEGTGVNYQARTVFIVFKANSALQSSSDLAQIWGHYTSGTQLSLETRPGSGGPGKYSTDGNSTRTGKVSIDGEEYGGFDRNPSSPTPWSYDQYHIATLEFAALSPTLTTHIIGDLISPANHNFGGEIAEIIVYNSTLNDSFEKLRVNNYLGNKYNISLTYNTDNTLYTDATYNQQLIVIGENNSNNYDTTVGDGGAVYLEKNLGTFDVDERIWMAHNGSAHGISNSDVSGTSRWKRIYRLQRDNPTGSLTSVNISFGTQDAGFGDNDADGKVIGDYKLLYRSGTSGVFSEVAGATGALDADKNKVTFTVNNADLVTGYYTLGIPGGNVWYTYLVSGYWDDPDMWTKDPSGTLYINSGGAIPSGSDEAVILNGKTVTDTSGNKTVIILTVKSGGILDIEDNTGYNFSTINGAGTIRLKADNFPAYSNMTDFATKGKVEFYGGSYVIATDYNFNNVDINLDLPTNTIFFTSNLTTAGDLIIESGVMQIGDNTSTSRTIDINGDLFVQSNGSINVEQSYSGSNVIHRLELAGDFTNEGNCIFSDAGGYDPTGANVDIQVDVRFNSSISDQKVYLDGTTNFYRIVSDKGADANYLLDIEAVLPINFNLFGKNNGGGSTGGTGENNNALGLKSGTVKLNNNIVISELKTGGGNYDIPEGCILWISNSSVTMSGQTALVAYGGIKVSEPLSILNIYSGSGITLRELGFIDIQGGTVNLNQVRRSTNSGTHLGAYKQSGGYVTVADFGVNSPSSSFSLFDLCEASHTFEMTGGTLHIIEDYGGGNDGTNGAFFVNSDPEYFNVTGGTVIFESQRSTASTLTISTRVNLPNVIFRNNSGNIIQFQTKGTTGYNSNVIPDSAFTVIGNLTIETANINFDHNGGDVVLHGDFNVVAGSTIEYDGATKQNTFMFAGSGNRSINFGHLSGSAYQNFYRVDVNMQQEEDTLFLYGPNKDTTNNNNASVDNDLFRVNKSFYHREGVFDNRNFSITLKCDTIVNTGVTLGDRRGGGYNNATNPNSNNDRIRIMDFDNAETAIYLYQDNQARWGTVDLDTDSDYLDLYHDMNRFDRFYFKSGRVNMKNFRVSLPIIEAFNGRASAGGYSSEDMFVAGGNASDDGFSLSWGKNANTYLYPIGIGLSAPNARYTPITFNVTTGGSNNRTHFVVLVDDTLATADPTGTDILSMYWRAEYGWDGTEGSLPIVDIICNYNDIDIDAGDENNYIGGRVLDVIPFTRDSPGTVTTATNTITYTGITVADNASYTAGNVNRFVGSPNIFYSYGPGGTSAANRLTWSDPNSWSNVGHYTGAGVASSIPGIGDVVYIAFNPTTDLSGTNGVHYMDMDIDADVSLVYLEHRTVKDNLGVDYTETNSGIPRLTIKNSVNTAALGFVDSRSGEIVLEVNCSTCSSDPAVTVFDIPAITGDFATFAGGGNSDWNTFEFNLVMPANTVGYLPTTLPSIYPRLDINGNGTEGQAIIFTQDLDVRSRLRFYNDGSMWMNDGAAGDFIIERGIRFFGGNSKSYIKFQDKGIARTVICKEIFTMQSPDHVIFVDSTNSPANLNHRFIWGQTTLNDRYMDLDDGYLDFYVNQPNASQITFEIDNYDTSRVYGKETTLSEFYKIEVNTADTTFIRFNTNFLLSGDASGASSTKPLLLNSGKIILEDSDININISTGGGEYKIPENSVLKLASGQVNITNNSDLRLDGKLEITGGTLDMATDGNINNIQYTVGTGSILTMSSGSLLVGGHFMRQSDDDQAAINYTQTGGAARFGINGSEYNDRGIFEILGANSSYTRSGGSMNIESGNGSAVTAALLISNPGSFSESGTSTIMIGGGANAGATIGINSTEEINTLELSGAGDNPIGNMLINTLQIQNLIIGNGAELRGNDLDVYVSDSWTNNNLIALNGFVAGSGNTGTTYCIGTRVDITGNTQFNHLTNNCTDRVVLGLNSDTYTNNIRNNSLFYTNDNYLHIQGDAVNNSWFLSNAGSVVFDGAEIQYIQSESGTSITDAIFQKMTINNSSGVRMLEYTGKPLQITLYDEMELQNGVFYLGDNYFQIFGSTVFTGTGYSKNKMLETNGRTSSKGIYLNLQAGETFTQYVPIGVTDKFSPVDIDLTNSGTGKSLIVLRAINEQHPTTLPSAYSQELLAFYWRLFYLQAQTNPQQIDGTVKFYYNENDITGDENLTYGSAKFQDGDWILSVPTGPGPTGSDVDGTLNEITFTITNLIASQTIDYTCGDTKTINPKTAFPINVPIYVSQNTGIWNNAANWLKDGVTNEIPSIGSKVQVQSTDTITFDANSINIYNLQIDGKVKVNNTIKHNLGIVTGNGIIEMESGQFPGGAYDEFLKVDGGVVEYGGTGTYTTSAIVTAVRGLIFSGTGTRVIPALATTIGDSILIDNVTVNNTINNSSFDLQGDIAIRNGGEFLSGTGGINFVGSSDSHIKTAMKGSNKLAQLTIAKTSGDLYIDTDTVLVKNTIDFQKGRIIPGDFGTILMDKNLTYVTSPWDSSYVEGSACKELINGGTFSFPIGDNYKYAYSRVNSPTAGIWCSRYYNSNPTSSGYNTAAFKTETPQLTDVSEVAFWDIEGPAGAQANGGITLKWRLAGSPYTDITEAAVAEWDPAGTPTAHWYNKGGSYNTSNNELTSGGVVTFSKKQFTFASVGDPLPVTYIDFTATLEGQDVILDWSTASEKNNDHFEIEKSFDLKSFTYLGSVDGNGTTLSINHYDYVDKNVSSGTIYYRLKQVDFNGDFSYSKIVAVQVYNGENSDQEDFDLTLYPNPVTEGADVTFKFNHFENIISIVIYDITGTLIYENNNVGVNSENEYSTQLDLPGGLYIVKASSNSQSVTKRLVIE